MVVGRDDLVDRWPMASSPAVHPRNWAPSALIVMVAWGSKVDRPITRTFSSVRSLIFVPATNHEQTWSRTVMRLAAVPHCAPELAMSISPEHPMKVRSCSY